MSAKTTKGVLKHDKPVSKGKRGSRSRSGGKLTRSEAIGVRLDPKLKYLAEIAARHQRRTLSSFIEWAIEESLHHCRLSGTSMANIADEASQLWDVDESDRFVRLAFNHPELLNYEEQRLWKLI